MSFIMSVLFVVVIFPLLVIVGMVDVRNGAVRHRGRRRGRRRRRRW